MSSSFVGDDKRHLGLLPTEHKIIFWKVTEIGYEYKNSDMPSAKSLLETVCV